MFPFACAGGVCGTCRAMLVTGSVAVDENYALEQDERISLSITNGVADVVLDAPHKLNSLDEQALADLSPRRTTTLLLPPKAGRCGRCC